MLLCDLACSFKYNKNQFTYYSNKLISPGKFIFEETDISSDANSEDLSDNLWELSKLIIDEKT